MSRRKSRFRSRPESSSSSEQRAARADRAPAAPATPVNLADQYRYVIGDLQRVGVIAVLLIAVMIALRLFVIK